MCQSVRELHGMLLTFPKCPYLPSCHPSLNSWSGFLGRACSLQRFKMQSELFFFFFYFMIQHSQFGSKSLQNVTFSIESEKSLERKLIEETTIILKQKHMFSTNNLQQVILLNKYSSLIEAALSTTTSGYIICQKQQLKTISTLVKEKNGCMLSHG